MEEEPERWSARFLRRRQPRLGPCIPLKRASPAVLWVRASAGHSWFHTLESLRTPPFCSRIKCYCQGFCSPSHISSLCKLHCPGKIQIPNCPLFFFRPQHVSTYFNVFIFVCSLQTMWSLGAPFVPVWLKINLELELGLWKSLPSKTLEPTKKAKGHWSGCISFVAQWVDILQYSILILRNYNHNWERTMWFCSFNPYRKYRRQKLSLILLYKEKS